MIDVMPCGYGTLRPTGVRIWHQVSRRACAEVSAALEVSRRACAEVSAALEVSRRACAEVSAALEVSRRAFAEVSAALEVSHRPVQSSQQLQNLTILIVHLVAS